MKEKYDKRHESDWQMTLRIAKKFAVIFSIILLFDVLIELLLLLFHFSLECFFVLFEFFEYLFELLLEHVFDSKKQDSQIIFSNVLFVAVIYGVYQLSLKIFNSYVRIFRTIKVVWLRYWRRERAYWRALPIARKIKLIAAYIAGSFCTLLLFAI